MSARQITIQKPDDWHLHFRDEEMLAETVPATARAFGRAIVMPNLVPPVINAEKVNKYRERILAARPAGNSFEPLMTIYLTDQTTPDDIKAAKQSGVVAGKLYPAGATTNSASGVTGVEGLFPVFESMAENGMLLLVHGEVTSSEVDIFDREKLFIEESLQKIYDKFPSLKIVFEHITTSEAVDFVKACADNVAATITPQHLLLNRNDILVGGLRPHNYCLPILKRRKHQEALRAAVATGSKKFFLGTDSAPHEQHRKESSCGCAGCYSAPAALELYTQVFEDLDILDKLEGFASHFGADFYGLPRHSETITLVNESWQVPEQITLSTGQKIIPFYAGQTLNWRVQKI